MQEKEESGIKEIAECMLEGYEGPFRSIIVSPNGEYIIGGTEEGNIKIWEFPTGKLIRNILESGSVETINISPTGEYIISGSTDKTVKVWELETGRLVHKFEGHKDKVNSVVMTQDGKYIISGSKDETIKIWELKTGSLIRTFRGHSNPIESVAVSLNCKYIVSCAVKGKIDIWDFMTGELLHRFDAGGFRGNTSVIISPDGKYIVNGVDRRLYIWELESRTSIHELLSVKEIIEQIMISPDGKYIISQSPEGIITVWDIITGYPICLLEKHTINTRLVAISPNGLYIISGSREKYVKLWNFEKIEEEKQKIFEGHEADVRLIATSPDGKYVISSSRDGMVIIWEFKSKKIIYKFDDYPESLIISPDGKYFFGEYDDIFKIREFMTGKLVRSLEIEDHIHKSTISPDEKYIIYDNYSDIKVLELESEKLIRTFKGHEKTVEIIKFSLDGKYFLTGSDDKTVKVWEFETGKLIHTLYHDDMVRTMDVHPGGKYIVTGDMGNKVYVWEFETGEPIHKLKGHGGWILSVAFSPDGKYFISGSHYPIIEVWEFMTGRHVCKLEMHKDAVNVVIFTPDGKNIISGSDDKTLRIWNFEEILKADEEEKRKIAEIEELYIEGTKLFKKGEDLVSNKEFNEATFNMTEAIEKYNQGIKFAENYGLIELEKKLKNAYSNTNKEISRISRISKSTTPQKLPVEPKKIEEPKINAYRGGEIQGGKYIFKIKVQNNTKFNITDLIFQIISFPEDSTELVGDSSRKISKLSAKGLVSPTFEFIPTKDCITGTIHSIVTYIDHLDEPYTINVEPYTISIICGLLQAKKINFDEFYQITEELLNFEKTGEEISIPYNSKLIFNKLKILLPEQNFWMVTKPKEQILGNTFIGEFNGFAEGKYNKKNVGLKITITGDVNQNSCVSMIEVFAQESSMIPPLISELSKKIIIWNCKGCAAPIEKEDVEKLLTNKPIECKYCGFVITSLNG